jgi:hypothetical protein
VEKEDIEIQITKIVIKMETLTENMKSSPDGHK